MTRHISQLVCLSSQEWKFLLKALVMLPVILISLKITGFLKTRLLLRKMIFLPDRKTRYRDVEKLEMLITISRIVTIVANHGPLRANCLSKSLLVWWLATVYGIDTRLIIGVGKPDSRFSAHAWVEYRGEEIPCRLDQGRATKDFTPVCDF